MGTILRVEDNLTFSKKIDFLLPYFGLRAYRMPTYPVKSGTYTIVDSNGEKCGNWILWCPNENKNDSGCTNIVSSDGATISEYDGKDYLHSDNYETNRLRSTRVVFTKNKSGVWVFRGVYIPDYNLSKPEGNRVKNVFVRIATSIEVISKPGKMRIIESETMVNLPKPLNVVKIQEKNSLDTDYVDEVLEYTDGLTEIVDYVPLPEDAPAKQKEKGAEKYPRSAKVGAIALKLANYKCEYNPNHESFIKASNGNTYMEAHHLVPVAYQGLFKKKLDTPANIISLCCTCHRCIHFGTDKDKKIMLYSLYNERKEELKKVGIELTFEDLLKMY